MDEWTASAKVVELKVIAGEKVYVVGDHHKALAAMARRADHVTLHPI